MSMRTLRILFAAVLCLSLAAAPASADQSAWEVLARVMVPQGLAPAPEAPGSPVPPLPDEIEGIIQERHELFTLLAMAYAYTQLQISPPPGHDIAAVLAWSVEDTEKTPEFVIERNRNFERRGSIHHAEVNAILAAYKRVEDSPLPKDADRQERKKVYDQSLANATLYTTLEPCPMCATTIAIAKIPRAYFCMEDPGLRDPKTREPNVATPTEFFGRKLSIEKARARACGEANKDLWETIGRGEKVKITKYLADKGEAVFKPAYDALKAYKPRHARNKALLEAILKEVLPGEALPEHLAEARAQARGLPRHYKEQMGQELTFQQWRAVKNGFHGESLDTMLPLRCRKPLPAEEGGARPESLFK